MHLVSFVLKPPRIRFEEPGGPFAGQKVAPVLFLLWEARSAGLQRIAVVRGGIGENEAVRRKRKKVEIE